MLRLRLGHTRLAAADEGQDPPGVRGGGIDQSHEKSAKRGKAVGTTSVVFERISRQISQKFPVLTLSAAKMPITATTVCQAPATEACSHDAIHSQHPRK